jgi:hypothetical protein
MSFTGNEVQNIANATMDFYLFKGEEFHQTLQNRPTYEAFSSKKKTFPGGKGSISLGVNGAFGDGSGNDVVKGYTHNDTVVFYTPANIKRANYPWREHHVGITFTHTELKIDGISVVDPGSNGTSTSNHSQREMTVLVGLLQDKLFDLGEQYARGMNLLTFGDGTADPKAMAGLGLLVSADPSIGVVGGLDRANASYTWWRNRARTAAFGAKVTGTPALAAWGGDAITSDVADGGALLQTLQYERRQLIRYGGKPDLFVAGSSFIDAMEKEMRANGVYTMNGFSGTQDGAMGKMNFGGQEVQYDPTLDDLGLAKRAYWIDSSNVFLEAMEEEWMHTHTPARPANQFIMYRSMTTTCQMVGRQFNSSLVIDIK